MYSSESHPADIGIGTLVKSRNRFDGAWGLASTVFCDQLEQLKA